MFSIAVVLILAGPLRQAQADTTPALRPASEAAFYARRDGGVLWATPLTTPLLIVDPVTRRAVSSVPDSAGVMVRDGSLYSAPIPNEVQLANTSLKWAGRTWAMVLTPLPADSVERGILLMHEVWHSTQSQLGIPVATPDNPHLATASGRTWMRVEGRALDAALASSGTEQRRAIADAIAARHLRRAAAPGSDLTERQLELTEGLAEYTGIVVVVVPAERAQVGRDRLARLEAEGSLVRSFPYATGSAWTLLLDMINPGWREYLTPATDLALMVAGAMRVDTATINRSDARFAEYALDEIRSTEMAREAAQVALWDSLRARHVTGPTLRLPLAEGSWLGPRPAG